MFLDTFSTPYLSSFTKFSFSDLIFGLYLCVCIGFLFSQPQTYIWLISEAVTGENTRRTYAKGDRCLILFERSYCVFAPQSFVTKCFLIFIIDEMKNFATSIFFQLVIEVAYQDQCNWLVTYWDSCIKGWCSYIEEFRGSEAVEGFCCKFIYGDCRVQRQKFCTRSETSLYYSELLFGEVSPQVFYSETGWFHWFFQVIISCLIYFSAVHDFDMILIFVCFNKFYL